MASNCRIIRQFRDEIRQFFGAAPQGAPAAGKIRQLCGVKPPKIGEIVFLLENLVKELIL